MKYIGIKKMALAMLTTVTVGVTFSFPVQAAQSTEVGYEQMVSVDADEELLIAKEQMRKLEISETYTMEKKSVKTAKQSNFQYLCYRPEASKDEAKPLIVYLHGKDGCGSNLDRLLQIESIPSYIEKGLVYPDAVVISPQCPSGSNWVVLADDVMSLIQTVIEEENIDETRISLTGCSLGGIGTYRIAIKNPDYFSAVVPVCGSVNAADCKVLTNTQVRIFHGTLDYGMGFSSKTAAQVIQDNGGTCELVMLEGEGHEIRHVYYDEEYDLLNWMAKQQRANAE